MNPPGLFDGSFAQQNSVSFGGDRLGEQPSRFQWLRGKLGRDVTFYTDQCLEMAANDPGRKVAWLIEPPSLHVSHYIQAVEMESIFDYILTFHAQLLNRGEKWLYYPCGGSWLKPDTWAMWPKTKDCSIMVSEKVKAPGHKLRRAILERFGDRMDAYGRGVKPIDSKATALKDYRYSIVVESIKLDGYFSEKLIDCISQGTVPIYWGDPTIGETFDLGGMLQFDTLDELGAILDETRRRNVYARLYADMVENLLTAREYACAEDWIFDRYPWLFTEQHG